MARGKTRAASLLALSGLLLLALVPGLDAGVDLIFEDGFENHDPVITSSPLTAVSLGNLYSYDVDAQDVDGDTLLYVLTTSPAGMTIDPVSGLIQWTPNALGTYPVAVDVSDGQGGSAAQGWDIEVLGIIDSDGDGLLDGDELILGTDPNDPDTDDDGLSDGEEVNTHGTDPLAFDTDMDGFGDGSELAFGTNPLDGGDFPAVPPDPSTMAPEIDPTQAGDIYVDTQFLYTGINRIQTGVLADTIDRLRVAVIRGKLLSRAGQPIPGAEVRILGHPEFGTTMSRADGMYDIVVNGGGMLTVNIATPGYLPAQRKVSAPWRRYVINEEAVLIALDTIMTPVDLGTPGDKIARGSVSGDADGTRRATVLFPDGVNAELVMPDGATQPISNLSVRATEYTVGERGPETMPGLLPPTSGYTYAVELSVDQAISMGASNVTFDQPLPTYVENFLGFPTGSIVPSGYYDMESGSWVPSANGLVIKIIGETGGMADLDIDGDDVADTGSPLDNLGITDTERTHIADLYEPGQSVWRVPVTHFTPVDHNWPYGPPLDAEPPSAQVSASKEIEQCIAVVEGSIVDCQNQSMGERLPITGTPYTLNYNSKRAFGYAANRQINVAASGPGVPASLESINVRFSVGGQEELVVLPALPNQGLSWQWDGNDAYGRRMSGSSTASVRVGYEYQWQYYGGNAAVQQAFGQFGQEFVEFRPTRDIVALERMYTITVGSLGSRGPGLGGWSIDVHHVYDPSQRVLYFGSGGRRSGEAMTSVLSHVAGRLNPNGYPIYCDPGQGQYPLCGDGGPAEDARLFYPRDIAIGPDGSVYIAEHDLHVIRRIDPAGIIDVFAGTPLTYYLVGNDNGDGGPALDAKLSTPLGVGVDQAGNVYVGEAYSNAIRKIDTNGIITTIAGGNSSISIGVLPQDIQVAANGDVYFHTSRGIEKLDTASNLTTVVPPFGSHQFALGSDDSLYFAGGNSNLNTIQRLNPDGTQTQIAGTGTDGFSGDGGPALDADIDAFGGIVVAPDSSVYFSGLNQDRVRRISPDGIISTVAGFGPGYDTNQHSGIEGPAVKAWLGGPQSLALSPDGDLYVASANNWWIVSVNTPLAGFGASEYIVPAEDGSEVFRFDSSGRHLQTIHSLTGSTIYDFSYDAAGRLESITDGNGNITTIQRDGSGHPAGITGPFGQQTLLSVDANGFLDSVTNPAGENLLVQSTADGMITQITDPRGRVSTYSYDALGRLASQIDNAGQSQTFARTTTADSFDVNRTTGLGRAVNYDVQQASGTSQLTTNTAPDGSQNSVQIQTLTGTTTATSATGMTSTVVLGPDPRFGMQAPIVESAEVSSPGGHTFTASSSSAAVLSNPADPLSLVSLSSAATIDGRTSNSDYDAASRTEVTTSPAGRTQTTTIDSLGRVTSYQFADLAPLTISYNGLGQLETLTAGTGPDARTTSFTYGADGFRQSITDSLGQSVSYLRDNAGRVTSKTLPGPVTAVFGYNAAGDMDSITPPGRPEHTFTYTFHGQLASITPPVVTGSGSSTLTYNDDWQLTSVARPGDELVEVTHDNEGRAQTIMLSEGGVPAATYSYSYLVADQIDTIFGPGSQAVSYDYQGDLVTGETWGGVVEGSVSWAYDNAFRVASETVDGGASIAFSYDDDDLFIGSGDFTIERSPTNGLAQNASIGVIQDNWTYNVFGEVASHSASANAIPVYEASYTRNKLGHIVQKVETIGGITDTYDYDYDETGQIIEVQKNSVVIESYSYDINGNRLSGTVGGFSSNGTYDDQDRLISYGGSTYNYTGAGRLLSRTEPGNLVTEYDYDVVGNLRGVTLPDATEITYSVDGADRRVQRAVDTSISYQFLYDGILPMAKLDEFGNVIAQYVYAGSHVPVYMIQSGSTYRMITDQVGSVRLVVNVSDGSIDQRLDYDSFGAVLLDTNPGFQPFGFAGGLYDPAAGLLRFGARDYDPTVGRWTTKDPTGFGGGDSNLYRYTNNNPINYVDFNGTDLSDVALGGLNVWLGSIEADFLEFMRLTPAGNGLMSLYDTLDYFFDFEEPHLGGLLPPPKDIDDFNTGQIAGICLIAAVGIASGVGTAANARKAARLGKELANVERTAARLAEKEALRKSGKKIYSNGKAADAAADARNGGRAYKPKPEQISSEAMPSTPGNGPKFGGI